MHAPPATWVSSTLMSRRFLTLIAAVAAVAAMLAVPPMRVAACSCAMPNPVEAQARADIVFVGAVADTREAEVSLESDRPAGIPAPIFTQVSYLFAVEEVRKGPAAASVVVTSSKDGASCGAGFSVDSRWLVYGTRAADGTYSSNLCEPNQLLGDAAEVPEDAAQWPDEAAATPDANTGIPLQMLVMALVVVGLAVFSAVAFLWRGRSAA